MRIWFFSFILVAAAIIQPAFPEQLKILHIGPDFPLVVMVMANLYLEGGWCLFFSLCAGISKDIWGAETFGVNMFLFPLWGIAIRELSKKIALDSRLLQVALISVIVILHNIMIRLTFFYSGVNGAWGAFLLSSLIASIYTSVVSWAVFKIIDRYQIFKIGQ